MGIVLTYKATGIFNFAHGAIAMFVAYVLWQLNNQWHVSLAIAAPVTIFIVAPALGLLLERVVFRPLQKRGAGTSEKLVATLAVVARLVSIPAAVAAGVLLLGVLQSLLTQFNPTVAPVFHWHWPAWFQQMIGQLKPNLSVLILFAALLLYRNLDEVGETGSGV